MRKPPEDTRLLLGFVKGGEHYSWIATREEYNLRADDRRGSVGLSSPELGADIVLLYQADLEEVVAYRTTGAIFVRSGAELSATGYPNPRGALYACIELGEQVDIPVDGALVRSVAGRSAEPIVVSWLDLLSS